MAIKKIEMRPKGDGTYADVLYPKTSTDMVEGLSTALSGKANSSHTHTSADLPNGTTSAKGVVQLSTATNSTSTTLAATPSAVKSAYDLANGKEPALAADRKRKITLSTVEPTNTDGADGDVWFVYKV